MSGPKEYKETSISIDAAKDGGRDQRCIHCRSQINYDKRGTQWSLWFCNTYYNTLLRRKHRRRTQYPDGLSVHRNSPASNTIDWRSRNNHQHRGSYGNLCRYRWPCLNIKNVLSILSRTRCTRLGVLCKGKLIPHGRCSVPLNILL